MTSTYQKKAIDLTSFEKEQIVLLLKRYYPDANNQYIESRISHLSDFDIVILKEGNKMHGVSYFKVNKLKTPFSNKKITVVFYL